MNLYKNLICILLCSILLFPSCTLTDKPDKGHKVVGYVNCGNKPLSDNKPYSQLAVNIYQSWKNFEGLSGGYSAFSGRSTDKGGRYEDKLKPVNQPSEVEITAQMFYWEEKFRTEKISPLSYISWKGEVVTPEYRVLINWDKHVLTYPTISLISPKCSVTMWHTGPMGIGSFLIGSILFPIALYRRQIASQRKANWLVIGFLLIIYVVLLKIGVNFLPPLKFLPYLFIVMVVVICFGLFRLESWMAKQLDMADPKGSLGKNIVIRIGYPLSALGIFLSIIPFSPFNPAYITYIGLGLLVFGCGMVLLFKGKKEIEH